MVGDGHDGTRTAGRCSECVARSVFAAIVACALILPGAPALGKTGKAWLLTTIPLEAVPGTTRHVAWVLREDDGSSFNALGVFVRLLTAPAEEPTEGFASPTAHITGEYEADVLVPDGGIRGVEIGVAGTARGPGVPAHRADALFPIANVERIDHEIRPVATPPPDRHSGPSVTSSDPGTESARFLISVTVIAGVLGIGIAMVKATGRRRRGPAGPETAPPQGMLALGDSPVHPLSAKE